MSRRSLRHNPVAARGRAGPQPHETTGSHLHPRQRSPRAGDESPDGADSNSAFEQEDSDRRYERPSKSQLKREMTALQELGERLLALPLAKLRKLPIPEHLIEAIELAQRISNSREGLRRQRQYIGKLMRDIDPEPLRDALSADGARHRGEVAAMHAAERWRDRLLAEASALDEFVSLHPGGPGLADELARLVQAAHAEKAKGQPGRRYRELYRLLRDTLTGSAAESPGSGNDD